MNLLFIFTGGTIGSTVSGDYISTDENKPYELINTYCSRYGLDHSYDIMTPYTELSEQNTGVTISRLVKCLREVVQVDGGCSYDGIIVTHGTDSLPYSAAALSYALGNQCIPVCIVSSNYPIADDRANGIDNLHGAIRLIEAGMMGNRSISDGDDKILVDRQFFSDDNLKREISGVFVPYRNHDGIIYIHRASKLLETAAFSDEYFSAGNKYYGSIVEDQLCINDDYEEKNDELAPFGDACLDDINDRIFRYKVYPGIHFDLPEMITAIKERTGSNACVLLEGYHSGTINTKYPGYQEFFRMMDKEGIPVFLTGIKEGVSYESTSLFRELGIKPLYNMSPVAAYMKIWMMMAAGMDITPDSINKSLGGDL